MDLPVFEPLDEDQLRADVVRESREPVAQVLRELRSSPSGLTRREAQRRLEAYGPNALPAPRPDPWWRSLATQFGHPLALLLWGAAALAIVSGTPVLSLAIVAVIVLNAVFALVQERQAQRAVAALSSYLPSNASVLRDGSVSLVAAVDLVPGDVVLIEEGDRVPADGRLLAGALQLDMSALTGESAPVERGAGRINADAPLFSLPDLVFSGTLCTGGSGRAVILSTGSRSELGRIAALTSKVRQDRSPLESQVRRVAWLIAGIGITVGVAFLPLGLLAGLSLNAAVLFAIGLLVANVPEGLLPTITLALAHGVRELGREGAVVKRLSAVETLGSTTVICTDKTGTLTLNQMQPAALWLYDDAVIDLTAEAKFPTHAETDDRSAEVARSLAGCSVVHLVDGVPTASDPTDLGLEKLLGLLGGTSDPAGREARRAMLNRFDPDRRLCSAVQREESGLMLFVRGAPESLLSRSVDIQIATGPTALDARSRQRVLDQLDAMTSDGLRVIAVARRHLATMPGGRDEAEQQLTFLGLVALHDPPRPEVAAAVDDCHTAGIRIHIVTGDNGNTAAHVARQVGIGGRGMQVIDSVRLEGMPEAELDELLRSGDELVFARSAPEAKLRIADALRAQGEIVAMTGDGVNDAPALHRADIGVAMGIAGTEVAREAATMVLTDDDFATLVRAVRAGRQVYDNVRKFILYIFAHAVPEIVPFLVFALSGGSVPLPLTVMQILAIDLGTETLPALALGREPAEPGLMSRPPRGRNEGVINKDMLLRAWAYMGLISAALVMTAFFYVLWRAGWHPGDPTGPGHPLHHAYLQATTSTWAALVACQIGTAFAARTDHASLRRVGIASNRMLLWGIAFEVAFSAALIFTPGLRGVFGMTAPPVTVLLLIAPFPAIVWGADEIRRARRRRAYQAAALRTAALQAEEPGR